MASSWTRLVQLKILIQTIWKASKTNAIMNSDQVKLLDEHQANNILSPTKPDGGTVANADHSTIDINDKLYAIIGDLICSREQECRICL